MRGCSVVAGIGMVLVVGVLVGLYLAWTWWQPRLLSQLSTGSSVAGSPRPVVPTVVVAPSGQVTVEISEADVARELNARLAGHSLGQTPFGAASVETFTVAIRAGQMNVGGNAKLGTGRMPFTVVAMIRVDGEGRPVVHVTDARFAGFALPDAMRERVQEGMQTEIDRQLGGTRVKISSVELEGGKLRVIGTPIR